MKELIKKLKKIKGESVLVVAHEVPDGDAIGSSIGFSMLLKERGARVLTVNKDETPKKYKFLEDGVKISRLADVNESEKGSVTKAFVLDSGNIARLGFDLKEEFPNINEVINIDHHVSNSFFGDSNFVFKDKGATSEIVGDLYLSMNDFISKEGATALYTGIMTDTGNLTYEATSTGTVALVSILMNMGADYNRVRKEVYERSTIGQIEGLKAVLNNLKISDDGLLAYTYIPLKVMVDFNLTSADLEDFVDYPRKIDTAEVAIFFKEVEGEIRVSVRTKSYVDANKLASTFKGGGHVRASGFRVRESLEDSISFVVNRVKEGLKNNEWSN